MPTVLDVLMQRFNTNPIFQTVEARMKALNRFVEEHQSHIKEFFRVLENFPHYCKDALETMANHEWYPDNTGMSLKDILRIGNDLKNDSYSCNLRLVNHFRSRVDDLEKELIGTNTDRQHIISEGFSNHREGRYYSSIPIFLSQTDGVFTESSNASPFMLKGRGNVSNDPHFNEISRHLFSINTLPIWISEAKRLSSFAGLNRHQVLHGEAVSYGTEENSLKAISFLSFINALCENFLPPTKAPSIMS